jgi:hypothetical protein
MKQCSLAERNDEIQEAITPSGFGGATNNASYPPNGDEKSCQSPFVDMCPFTTRPSFPSLKNSQLGTDQIYRTSACSFVYGPQRSFQCPLNPSVLVSLLDQRFGTLFPRHMSGSFRIGNYHQYAPIPRHRCAPGQPVWHDAITAAPQS